VPSPRGLIGRLVDPHQFDLAPTGPGDTYEKYLAFRFPTMNIRAAFEVLK
jgi:hypothetical protein